MIPMPCAVRVYPRVALLALTAALAIPASSQERKPARPKAERIAGKVVDDKNKPVKDFEVGSNWRGTEKELSTEGALKTDKNGKFSGEMTLDPKQPVTLFAFDRTRKQGGWAIVADDKLEQAEIVVGPMTSVTGTFDLTRLKSQPETVEIIVQTSPDRLELVRYEVPAKRKFAFRLPTGDYEISLSCDGGDREPRRVTIAKGKTQFDLEKLALRPVAPKKITPEDSADAKDENGKKAGPGKQSAGKPPPALTVTEARGVKKDVKLADYKGKWVLLDFWGVWCPPCVRGSIPALLDFDEKHKDDRDRYVILTMHCGGGRVPETLAAMDAKLPDLEKNLWKGRKFPFPVLIDSTQKTLGDWGINSFPTQCLIDPSGNLVAQANNGIEARLAKELSKPAEKPESDEPKKKDAKKPGG